MENQSQPHLRWIAKTPKIEPSPQSGHGDANTNYRRESILCLIRTE